MKEKKVIISEELLKRQPSIELQINNKKVVFNEQISKPNYKVYDNNLYHKYQNFNLERDNVLTLRRVK